MNGWKAMSQRPWEVPIGMSQLSEEPQRIPHLEHGEQLQLDGKRHVSGTCAVHGVTCALHEHRHPAPHAQRIRVALPGRPHVGIAIGPPAAHVRSSLSVNNTNLQHMWHLSVSRIYQASTRWAPCSPRDSSCQFTVPSKRCSQSTNCALQLVQ